MQWSDQSEKKRKGMQQEIRGVGGVERTSRQEVIRKIEKIEKRLIRKEEGDNVLRRTIEELRSSESILREQLAENERRMKNMENKMKELETNGGTKGKGMGKGKSPPLTVMQNKLDRLRVKMEQIKEKKKQAELEETRIETERMTLEKEIMLEKQRLSISSSKDTINKREWNVEVKGCEKKKKKKKTKKELQMEEEMRKIAEAEDSSDDYVHDEEEEVELDHVDVSRQCGEEEEEEDNCSFVTIRST